jgi:hypothetical protein
MKIDKSAFMQYVQPYITTLDKKDMKMPKTLVNTGNLLLLINAQKYTCITAPKVVI